MKSFVNWESDRGANNLIFKTCDMLFDYSNCHLSSNMSAKHQNVHHQTVFQYTTSTDTITSTCPRNTQIMYSNTRVMSCSPSQNKRFVFDCYVTSVHCIHFQMSLSIISNKQTKTTGDLIPWHNVAIITQHLNHLQQPVVLHVLQLH